jgi:hypothetical protein
VRRVVKLQRFHRIFSGEDSIDLWDDINAVKKRKIHDALYTLGCRCQELESVVHQLEERIAELERK